MKCVYSAPNIASTNLYSWASCNVCNRVFPPVSCKLFQLSETSTSWGPCCSPQPCRVDVLCTQWRTWPRPWCPAGELHQVRVDSSSGTRFLKRNCPKERRSQARNRHRSGHCIAFLLGQSLNSRHLVSVCAAQLLSFALFLAEDVWWSFSSRETYRRCTVTEGNGCSWFWDVCDYRLSRLCATSMCHRWSCSPLRGRADSSSEHKVLDTSGRWRFQSASLLQWHEFLQLQRQKENLRTFEADCLCWKFC